MKKKIAFSLVLVIAAATGGWWWLHRSDAAKPAASANSTLPAGASANVALVTLVVAQRENVPVTVQINGNVVPLNSVDLRSQITNTVRVVHVKEGQFVKAGQLLFTLDERVNQANLARARAQQQKDEATLVDIERQQRRSQELLAQNFISKAAADATSSQRDAQRAAIAADRAAVQSAEVTLSYDTLRAPIAGRIGAVNIYPGTLVQTSTTMGTITQLDPIAVSFPVPEAQLQYLVGATRGPLPVEARLPGRAEPAAGALSFVDNTVDPAIGTVRAKAVFDNPERSLWPGQFVEVRLTVRTLTDASVIPSAAVMTLADGDAVYVIDAQQKATLRKVKTLHTFGTRVAVSGVEADERVVVEGKQNVRPGGGVRTEAAVPAAAASSASGGGGSAKVGLP